MAIAIDREQGMGNPPGVAYNGLRGFLEAVDRMGQLRFVHGANADEEIGAATDVLQHSKNGPAVVFDQVPGYAPDFRVAVNLFGSTDRIALTLGVPLGLSKVETSRAWGNKLHGTAPIPYVEVTDGPVMENSRRGDEVDLTIFPTPIWHPNDGGRYIGTGSYDVTLDPDDGWINTGTYRVMLHDRNHVGYYISPGKHGRMHRQKYFDRGQPCPVVMVFGGDPLQFLASCTELPLGTCEYDWVGGIRGEAVKVIRGPVTGLPFPADAEIVIEGFAHGDEVRTEGPFGEWTGYYGSAEREEPVLKVEALYYRNQPILVGSPPGQPPDELSHYRCIMRSPLLEEDLRKAGVPDVVATWQHEVGGGRLFMVVAIKQRYPGHARQALHVASQCHAGAYAGRWVVVVDDDIDPTNLEEVMWAMCTRVDPATDIDIIHRAWSTPLDPVVTPTQRANKDYTNSRGLIDACRPFEWRDQFPPVNLPPREVREAAMKRWSYLLGS
jgi:UbiD family decarboxylase